MTYIRDLVKLDQHAEFRNDVQLSHYDNQAINLGLLRSFIFSSNAPAGKVSAVDLLDTMRSVFSIARQENRLVCIANYGHGKSHLALVLANYFAKPFKSPEIEQVMAKLTKAVDNQTRLTRLKDFKQDYGEFLVIRLRGDVNRGLREQFIDQLQAAFKDHEATRNIHLSFWSDKALQLLDKLTKDQRSKAEEFLLKINTDLANLRRDVSEHRDQGYDRVRQLFQQLTGVLPDLGGEVSLNVLLKQVAKEYCDAGKPFSGVVILFDEFSLFVQRYAQRRSAGELQELLVGVEELGNKALFLAFSQHDPLTVAKNYSNSQDQVDNLEKELSRLPKERRIILYSLLESVIDAYLSQPERTWETFALNREVRGPLARASSVAMALFSRRYEDELRWSPEKFDQIVTRGAFPLHPLTTAMLCNLTLGGSEALGNPRTLLGFIREQVMVKQDELALIDKKMNWILPIFLVEYFQEYLGREFYQLYEMAESKLPENAPPEQRLLLKALLLQNAAGLKIRRDDQISFLGEAAGIDFNTIKSHLNALTAARCILKDEAKGIYTFWASTIDPDAIKKKLQTKLAGKEVTWDLLEDLTRRQTKAIPVGVNWGHQEDWEAKEVLLTRKFFTSERLKQLFPVQRMSATGVLEDGVRGGVVWVVPETSDDAAWFKENSQAVLNQAFPGDTPIPVVVKLTSRLYPKILPAFQTLKELEMMTEQERKEVTIQLYEHEKRDQEEIIRSSMESLRGEPMNYTSIPHKVSNYLLPSPYHALVSLSVNPTVKQVLEELYRHAYRFSPPEFFTQYRTPGTNNLWKATKLLSTLLLRNRISSNMVSLQTDKVAVDLLNKFLLNKWRIVRADHAIQEPGNGNIAAAWSLLEATFKPGKGSKDVRDTLVKLMDPPYGYDYSTLTLLLCSWIGYNQHDLQFSSMGKIINLEGLTKILNDATGSKTTFIGEICGPQKVAISRRDSAELVKDVTTLIKKVDKETFDLGNAEVAIASLRAYYSDASLTEAIREAAKDALDKLSEGYEKAADYDKKAGAIKEELENGREINSLLQLRKRIGDLPHAGLVTPTEKSISELDNLWRAVISKKVEAECARLEAVTRLQEVQLNQHHLEKMESSLKTANLPTLMDRVKKALKEIERRERELDTLELEEPIRNELQAMDKGSPLRVLNVYLERLDRMQGFSKSTMELRDQIRSIVKLEISQLDLFTDMMREKVDEIDSLESAGEWEKAYWRNIQRFEETDMYNLLEALNNKVSDIKNFYKKVQDIKQQPQDDRHSMEKKLTQLDQLYKSGENLVGAKPLEVLDSYTKLVLRDFEKREIEAQQWLEDIENQFEKGGALTEIVRSLEAPATFLRVDGQHRLEKLKRRVDQQQENDVIAKIELEFRKIKDLSLRQACLQRLQAILKETEVVSAVKDQ